MERVRIGFLMRLIAAVIDGVVSAILIAVPTVILSAVVGHTVGAIVGGLAGLAYWSLEIVNAQSVGKMVFGYTITQQDGSPATRDQLIKRYAYKQVPAIIGLVAAVPMLGLLNILGGLAALAIVVGTLMTLKPERLAFHDKLFGTAVFGPSTVTATIPYLNKQVYQQQPPAAPVVRDSSADITQPLPPLPTAQAAA